MLQSVQLCKVPCDAGSVQAMVVAMTRASSRRGAIGWADFRAYLAAEFAAGRNLLVGSYVLPTGQPLPFGLTIKRLKRHRLLRSVMAGGADREAVARQWEHALLADDSLVRFPASVQRCQVTLCERHVPATRARDCSPCAAAGGAATAAAATSDGAAHIAGRQRRARAPGTRR